MNKIADTSLISAERSSLIQLHGKKVYVAGPMTGLPEFNYPAFFAAEEYLRSHGAKVMNQPFCQLDLNITNIWR